MVKVSSSDIVAILRRFELARDDVVPRHIEQIRFTHPSATNTLISFRFQKTKFYILLDDTAEDDQDYIVSQIRTDNSHTEGTLLENPTDNLMTYGLPFKGKAVYLFEVVSPRVRLDVELARRYPDVSRSTWQKHIKAGHVYVNDKVQTSPKFDIKETDAIALSLPEETDYSAESLPIIYLDDNVIVINKPAGILTHAKGEIAEEFTVADFFRRYSTYNLDTNRPGIIHRLDRDTSGVLIGARNSETATLLQKQFADRKTKKTYLAIVSGEPKLHEAQIDLPIGRNPSAPSSFRVDAKGKSAETHYEVIASNETTSLIKLSPRTGRTHQLRVHMQYIGTPILGDRVYGKPSQRLYLHAANLEITIPTSDRRIFSAPLPTEFLSYYPESDTAT